MSTRGFQSVVKLNLFGTWNVMKAVFEASMREHGGSIVNILVAMQNGYYLSILYLVVYLLLLLFIMRVSEKVPVNVTFWCCKSWY